MYVVGSKKSWILPLADQIVACIVANHHMDKNSKTDAVASMGAISFQPLTEELIPSAVELSTQAGWEQLPDDWARLSRLSDSGVWIWVDGGAVRASFSLAGYGTGLAWIGMILVDETYRGRGLGKAVFQAALAEAEKTGFQILGLDATALGEPIYLKFGFQTTQPIDRWKGMLQPLRKAPYVQVGLTPGILSLDNQVCEVDRTPLLEDLAKTGATFLSVEKQGETKAYAALRRSRTGMYLGPVVCSSAEDFGALLDRAAEFTADTPLICDVLQNAASVPLTERGLASLRHLKRMTLPLQRGCLAANQLWCGAGFELG